MMPKGVEHCWRGAPASCQNYVRIPMMPKGVEHFEGQDEVDQRSGENSDDAERR